jgi:hypothetical protein
LLVLVIILAAGPAGCGSGGPGGDTAGAGGGESTLGVDRDFWYGGWQVRVVSAELSPDRGTATLHGTFTNLGRAARRFAAPLSLESGDRAYVTAAATHAPPVVPAGGSQDGSLGFAVDEALRLDAARLRVGDTRHRQAVVPLGTDDGHEPLAPRPFAVSGTVNTGQDPHLTVESGEIRADDPDGGRRARSGHS